MSNRPLDLMVVNTEDAVSRENFDRIRNFISSDLFTKFDGKFFEIEFTKAVTNLKVKQDLGFVPMDTMLTFESVPGAVTLNKHLFNRETFDITTSGAVKCRFVSGQFVIDR